MAEQLETHEQHQQQAKKSLRVAVITVSDTRHLGNDTSGQLIVDRFSAAGHDVVERTIVKDEPTELCALVGQILGRYSVDALLITGGTGLAPRDRTPEAIESLLDATIPGFGELFRMLSFQEIGAAAMLSRALAGRIDKSLVFCMPGSTAAVRLAVEKLLLPELPHLVLHARG